MNITTPRTQGFVTRAQWGARLPRSFSRNITPGRGGVAIHYGGESVPITTHSQCVSTWRSWQTFHLDGRGWADIAYTMGVCQHGYVFAGRGEGIRTAANGSNHGNQTHYAVCWIGGARQRPTASAIQAMAWAINELRDSGAGLSVKPHSHFNSTGCPGAEWTRLARHIDGKPYGKTDPLEEYYMSLSKSDREKLDTVLSLSQNQIENMVSYANTVGPSKLRILDDIASTIRERGTNGVSFINQLLDFNRDERAYLQEIIGHIKAKGSSVQGLTRGAINIFRHARDEKGWDIDTQ